MTNFMFEAIRVSSVYGRNVSHKDFKKMWTPINQWILENENIEYGEWNASHVSKRSLEKYDPRFELYRRYLQENSKQAFFLFQLYNIPAEKKCSIGNILHVGYNIGLYQGYYGHVSEMYEDDYYTTLFKNNNLGNVNSYVNDRSGIIY